jgi:ABC-type multidrug transport system fused ATPase/permease subunit
VVSLATLVVIAGVNLVRPLVMGDVVRQADAHDSHALMRDGFALAGLLVVSQLLTFVQMYAMQIAGARAMAGLRSAIFRFFQRLRLRYYDRTPVGRLVTRATNDVDALSELCRDLAPTGAPRAPSRLAQEDNSGAANRRTAQELRDLLDSGAPVEIDRGELEREARASRRAIDDDRVER